MSLVLKLVLISIILIFLLCIYKSIKENLISIKYSFMWIVAALLMLFAAIVPNFLTSISNFIGFEVASNMLFLVGFLILLFISFSLTVIVSIQKAEITTLIQELGILKSHVKVYEKES